jgi:glycosyltransferase involved in cell wall biosynthesis
MDFPLVSIVIATYKSRHDHIGFALKSAVGQTWPRIEVIVTDDSPDDALHAVVDSFTDARLRYRRNTPSLGVAMNHWVAFRECQGEFIVVLNHDDSLEPTFVEALVRPLIERPKVSLVFCDHWLMDESGKRLPSETQQNSVLWGRASLVAGLHQPFPALVVNQTIPLAMGAMFRRSALPPELPAHAGPAYDLWLAYLLCRQGGGAWYHPERLSSWRTHSGNLTSAGNVDWLNGSATCWLDASDVPLFAPWKHAMRRKAAQGFSACAVRSCARGRRASGFRFALRSLSAAPTFKGLAALCLPVLPQSFAGARWRSTTGLKANSS